MKNILLTFFLISLFLICITPFFVAEADIQPRALEVEYPSIDGFKPETVETEPANYVKYIFNFAILISGLIALGVLIYAGSAYLASAGNPEKTKDAKDQILSAFLGLIILLGSYLILTTINPQLRHFNFEPLKPISLEIKGGVLLCKEEIRYKGIPLSHFYGHNDIEIRKGLLALVKEKCRYSSTGTISESGFDNKTTRAYLIPDTPGKPPKDGAILYDKSNPASGGQNQIIYRGTPKGSSGNIISVYKIGNTKTSSVKNFIIEYNPSPDWYVELYELTDQNEADEGKQESEKHKKKEYKASSDKVAVCYDILSDFPYVEAKYGHDHQFQSVKVETKGKLIAIFFADLSCSALGNWTQDTKIYPLPDSDSNLNDNRPIKNWSKIVFPGVKRKGPVGIFPNVFPAAKSMVVLNASIAP